MLTDKFYSFNCMKLLTNLFFIKFQIYSLSFNHAVDYHIMSNNESWRVEYNFKKFKNFIFAWSQLSPIIGVLVVLLAAVVLQTPSWRNFRINKSYYYSLFVPEATSLNSIRNLLRGMHRESFVQVRDVWSSLPHLTQLLRYSTLSIEARATSTLSYWPRHGSRRVRNRLKHIEWRIRSMATLR